MDILITASIKCEISYLAENTARGEKGSIGHRLSTGGAGGSGSNINTFVWINLF